MSYSTEPVVHYSGHFHLRVYLEDDNSQDAATLVDDTSSHPVPVNIQLAHTHGNTVPNRVTTSQGKSVREPSPSSHHQHATIHVFPLYWNLHKYNGGSQSQPQVQVNEERTSASGNDNRRDDGSQLNSQEQPTTTAVNTFPPRRLSNDHQMHPCPQLRSPTATEQSSPLHSQTNRNPLSPTTIVRVEDMDMAGNDSYPKPRSNTLLAYLHADTQQTAPSAHITSPRSNSVNTSAPLKRHIFSSWDIHPLFNAFPSVSHLRPYKSAFIVALILYTLLLCTSLLVSALRNIYFSVLMLLLESGLAVFYLAFVDRRLVRELLKSFELYYITVNVFFMSYLIFIHMKYSYAVYNILFCMQITLSGALLISLDANVLFGVRMKFLTLLCGLLFCLCLLCIQWIEQLLYGHDRFSQGDMTIGVLVVESKSVAFACLLQLTFYCLKYFYKTIMFYRTTKQIITRRLSAQSATPVTATQQTSNETSTSTAITTLTATSPSNQFIYKHIYQFVHFNVKLVLSFKSPDHSHNSSQTPNVNPNTNNIPVIGAQTPVIHSHIFLSNSILEKTSTSPVLEASSPSASSSSASSPSSLAVSSPPGENDRLLYIESFPFTPIVPWSWVHRYANSRIYAYVMPLYVFVGLFFLMNVIALANGAIIRIILTVGMLFIFLGELSRFDQRLFKALLGNFEFWLTSLSVLQHIVFGMVSQWYLYGTVENVTSFMWFFMFYFLAGAMDAAPSYPRKLKAIVLTIMVINDLRILLTNILWKYTYSRVYVCYYLFCTDARLLALSAVLNLIIFQSKFLFSVLKRDGRCSILSLPLAYEFT